MRAFLPLLLLAACAAPANSTGVLHRFSDHALEIAQHASPGTEWELEVDPARTTNVPYSLPHTELVMLRGRVESEAALFENLEIEVMRTLLRQGMRVERFHADDKQGLKTFTWVYRWHSGEGVLTIWGSPLEGGALVLAITVHESRYSE
jgi:hypothetical protein